MKKIVSILSSFILLTSFTSVAVSCSLFKGDEKIDLSSQKSIAKYSFSNDVTTNYVIDTLRKISGLEKIKRSDVEIKKQKSTSTENGSVVVTALPNSLIVQGEINFTIAKLAKMEIPSDGSKISLLEHKDQIVNNIGIIDSLSEEDIINKFIEINKNTLPSEVSENDFYVNEISQNNAQITGFKESEIISSSLSNGLDLFFLPSEKTWEENPNYPQNFQGYYYSKDIPENDYYSQAKGLEGDELKNELSTIVNTNFNPISYGDVRYFLIQADSIKDENGNPEYVRSIYDGAHLPTTWYSSGNNAWQREHVWPSSRLGTGRPQNSTKSIASDLHNLRAISGNSGNQSGVNQSKSNLYYGGSSEDGKWKVIDKNVFYPGDEDKGDVARIAFYMLVKYPTILNWTNDPNILNNFTSYSPSGAYIGFKDKLLEWNKEDPVDEFEELRNETIYNGVAYRPDGNKIKAQGNKNPFIDHPEFAHLIWEDKTIEDLQL